MQWCGRVREQYVMVWEGEGAICNGVGGCGSNMQWCGRVREQYAMVWEGEGAICNGVGG